MEPITEVVQGLVHGLAGFLGVAYAFHVKAFLAVILVSVVCGMTGSLVVSNRMAFFSDAMAHCAFAGVGLGVVLMLLAGIARTERDWLLPLLMVAFGVLVGVAIAFVRERTTIASDTVIGVFFAGAIGFGAMLFATVRRHVVFEPEQFLFGSPFWVKEIDLFYLAVLTVLTAVVLTLNYNDIVFASFNPSLARSRRVAIRRNNYVLIVLLALIVNLTINAVGVLLINALLVVPAATASHLSRNVRQMFWLTMLFSVGAGVVGLWLSMRVRVPIGPGEPIQFGPGGMIVVLSVLGFFAAMAVPALGRQAGRLLRPGGS